jgi:hypothetical protein
MRIVPAAALLLLATTGRALAVVLGGGLADADCRVAFEDVDATSGASGVVCTDGDPTCDRDGLADGQCRFAVRLCTGLTTPTCKPVTLTGLTIAGLALPEPPLPSEDGACGAAVDVVVPVGTASGATVLARGGGELRDVDYLNLCCRSGAGLFDAARCAVAIDPEVSGCSVPRRIRRQLAAAQRLLDAGEPSARAVRRARKKLRAIQRQARRLAGRDACGNALGLVASHADDALGAAGATNLTR